MVFQLPPPIRRVVTDVGLRTWVDSDDCDRSYYWDAIASLKAVLARSGSGNEDDPKKIVKMLQVLVVDDAALEEHIFHPQNSPDVEDDDAYLRLAEAASWVLVQRYTREHEAGSVE